ncbi:unnamed protein product, partial [Heterotrigona itama]
NVVIIGSTLCPRLRPLPATPTNVFLGGLATADLLLILFCIPVKITVIQCILTNLHAPLHCKPVHAGLFRSYARLVYRNKRQFSYNLARWFIKQRAFDKSVNASYSIFPLRVSFCWKWVSRIKLQGRGITENHLFDY